MMNGNWQYIERQLTRTLGITTRFSNIQSVGGGCINQGWKVSDKSGNHWFVKTNQSDLLFMFKAEFQGLEALSEANCIRTPKPISYGTTNKQCYLIMEYIALSGGTQSCLTGKQLAQMHHCQSDTFGWTTNNSIGSTQQSNKPHQDWLSFWRVERLEFQLNLALRNGLSHKAYEHGLKLSDKLHVFFSGYKPQASLLHGDLWGGNTAYDEHQQPVIFDPAIYYGDHEADLAMTELFAGFSKQFYACYHEHYPIDSGYSTRKTLYNLYHILNHFNLFGGSYHQQVETMTKRLLRET